MYQRRGFYFFPRISYCSFLLPVLLQLLSLLMFLCTAKKHMSEYLCGFLNILEIICL